jgi:hypothetical protein
MTGMQEEVSMGDQNIVPENKAAACNGHSLKRLAQAGLAWLEKNYEIVNALNVFPVPDGDTGTNMLLTMRSACNEVLTVEEAHAGKVAHRLYNGALMGARGNSGVILSQLWRGFARGIEDEAEFNAEALARGLREAARTAYKAVQEPVEGTMLTVAREISEEADEAVQETSDMQIILERIVARGHMSVKRTPELLAVLKEAGVVDSGGMGLAYIVEGMLRHMRGETLETAMPVAEATRNLMSALEPEDEEGYGYDIQYLIKGQGLNVQNVRQTLEGMGWSTLVVGDESLIKVHIHVHNPGPVLGYGAEQGALLDVVVENMQEQYQEFVHERGGPQYSVPAPEPPRPPAIENGTIAVVTVTPGDGLTRIFYSLGAGSVVAGGQTMNPSTKDIMDAVSALPTDRVIILPNNKNIIMAAEQAASQIPDKEVRVVSTCTIPQGISALLALDPYGDLNDVVRAMTESSAMVETGEVTVSTRDATIDGIRVKKDQIIGLLNDRLTVAGSDTNSVVFELLEQMDAGSLELITLYYGQDVSLSEAEALATQLEERYPGHEIELREGSQPHYFYILSAE